MFPAHIQQPCLNVYCLALYASAQIGFSIAPVNCWFKYYSSSSVSGRIDNSSPNPRIQTKPFIFTHIGISCLIVMDIISMFFSYFPLFSEADSSQGGPQDRHVESSHSGQVCRGSDLRLHVRRDTDPTHPQRQRTVIPFAWESAELRMMKVQLDNHETALSIAKGKGVRQPVARDQHDRLSELPRPANAPAWAYS